MSEKIFVSRLEGTKLIVETADGIEEYDTQFLVAGFLVFIARASGTIEPEESATMIELIEDHFQMQSAEALELISRAMSETAENPQLEDVWIEFASTLPDAEKGAVALMSLKVIAADGHREFVEMEEFKRAMEALQISPDIVRKAYDQFFEETLSEAEEAE